MSFDAKREAQHLIACGVCDDYVRDGRTGLSFFERKESIERALQRAYEQGIQDGRRTDSATKVGGGT